MSTKWSTKEIWQAENLRASGNTFGQIAAVLGRSETAVRVKLKREGGSGVSFVDTPPEVLAAYTEVVKPEAPADDKNRVAYWKQRSADLEKLLSEVQSNKTAQEILCEQVHELAPKSYQPTPWKASKRPAPGSTPESAVLMFSDTHIGATVHANQTMDLGHYSFETFLRRLNQLEQSIFSIVEDHTTAVIPEIVVPMLGDMLDGALSHSTEAGQTTTMLSQFYSGGHAIAQFLRNLSVLAPLRIYGTVGNHPRWQNQHKMPSKNRNSNFDMLLYLYIQALTKDIHTIKWNLDWQPFATFDVQGFPFYALHGDNIRGGDKMLGLPAHAMGRMVGTTTQLFSRAGKPIPAYYLMGHLHRPIEIPHANGEVLVNGAFPGIDGYALGEFFNSSRPSQRFFFVHPKVGITASYKLRLDLGDETPHNYTLPESEFLAKE